MKKIKIELIHGYQRPLNEYVIFNVSYFIFFLNSVIIYYYN